MRKNQTPSEIALWDALRKYKTGGSRWRRQHIIDPFIVDFVHLGSKLAVEVDVGYHTTKEQQVLDQDGDEALRELGWMVIRVTNEKVLENPEGIALKFQKLIEEVV